MGFLGFFIRQFFSQYFLTYFDHQFTNLVFHFGQGRHLLGVDRCLGFCYYFVGFGLGLFLGMGAASASPGATVNTPMTPAWTVGQVNNVINTPLGQLSGMLDTSLTHDTTNFLSSKAGSIDYLSCRRYTAQLEDNSKSNEDKTGNDPTLIALNRMWEETGLRVWARAQYGPGDNGMQVFCRALEARGGVSGFDQGMIAQAAAGSGAAINGRAAA